MWFKCVLFRLRRRSFQGVLVRKCAVEVLLGWEQKEILDLLAMMLRIGASQAIGTAFMEYTKSLSLITEKSTAKSRKINENLNM